MTRLLQEAFAELQQLGNDEQDAIALEIMAIVAANSERESHEKLLKDVADGGNRNDKVDPLRAFALVDIETLDPDTRAAVLEGLAQAERGDLATDEVAALFKRHGL